MSDQTQVNYKKTLNLPKTTFPMKANLGQNEPQSLKRWQKQNLYSQIVASNDADSTFTFHDGPPYANGAIHVGHLLNKVLKDLVVRSQNLLGNRCEFIPGWDCHGLPIEHKVMTEIVNADDAGFNQHDTDTQRKIIRSECQKYASKYVKLQSKQMQRLLTMADYDKPYLTMTKAFEKRAIEAFAAIVTEGIVYRQLKPVHWSIANQTALADAELEYKDRDDTSIYVTFKLTNSPSAAEAFNTKIDGPVSIMIWTTTPWTLPANLAAAMNPKLTYALVNSDNGALIMAKERVASLQESSGKTLEIIAEAQGNTLAGLEYNHPFCGRTGKVVAADYVTLEDGSGIVHIAPGHGTEDYQVGLEEGLDIYCPVLADGTFDDSVPDWIQGKSVWDANPLITTHLKESGHLFQETTYTHSYPHDWRSKTPVIFRSTEQWFVSVDTPLKSTGKSLREMALNAIENDITFIPDWGQNRLRGMMESRPDWCLSRQRAWGLPIPAFKTENDAIFMTPASVQAIAKCFETHGSNAWFDKSPADLLADYSPESDPDAPDTLNIATLTKMYDIFDVWFESGSSWNGVLNERNQPYPADLYLEGSDQHRGWFHLSLLLSLGVTHQSSFKSVLTHGFIVDKDGQKMSKSGGNALNVDDLLQDYGAEITRWWVSSLSFEGDIKVDKTYFDVAADAYRKIRNTLRFLLSNIADFPQTEPSARTEALNKIDPLSLDGYILDRFGKLQIAVHEAYLSYQFRQANHLLYNFCNDTLSAFYLAAVKDRLYCDKPDSPRRRQTQLVLNYLLDELCGLLAPILPHTADEAYRSLYPDDPTKTIHLTRLNTLAYEADPDWRHVIAARPDVSKALENAKENGIENSLDAGIILPETDTNLQKFKADLPDIFGVSRVKFSGQSITVQNLQNEPRCDRSWRRDETVKKRSDGGFLSDRDAEAVGVSE